MERANGLYYIVDTPHNRVHTLNPTLMHFYFAFRHVNAPPDRETRRASNRHRFSVFHDAPVHTRVYRFSSLSPSSSSSPLNVTSFSFLPFPLSKEARILRRCNTETKNAAITRVPRAMCNMRCVDEKEGLLFAACARKKQKKKKETFFQRQNDTTQIEISQSRHSKLIA